MTKPLFNPGLRWVGNSAGQMTGEAQRLLRAIIDTAFKRTGTDDASVVTGTAGPAGNISKWDADGNLVDGGKVAADLLVNADIGVTVQGYSAVLTDLAARWTPASAASASRLDFYEDTDDGSNRVRVTAPTLSADRQFMLPNADVTMQAYIAGLLNASNNAGAQSAIGLVIGTDVQAYSAQLTDLAARWTAASSAGPASLDFREDTDSGTNRARIIPAASLTGDRTFTLPNFDISFSSFIAGLLDDANAAAAQTTLGLTIGTNVQAFDALLDAIAALTTSAGGFIRTTGSDTVAAQAIVGTVSQSGGTPTGSLFEYGSNSNGSYIRFADGTLICWGSVTSTGGTSTTNGSLFRTTVQTQTFPAAFTSTPSVSGGGSSFTVWPSFDPSSTATDWSFNRATTTATNYTLRWVAVGRWF